MASALVVQLLLPLFLRPLCLHSLTPLRGFHSRSSSPSLGAQAGLHAPVPRFGSLLEPAANAGASAAAPASPNAMTAFMAEMKGMMTALHHTVIENRKEAKADLLQERRMIVDIVDKRVAELRLRSLLLFSSSPAAAATPHAPPLLSTAPKQQARAASAHAAALLANRSKLGASVDQLASINQFMAAHESEFELRVRG